MSDAAVKGLVMIALTYIACRFDSALAGLAAFLVLCSLIDED